MMYGWYQMKYIVNWSFPGYTYTPFASLSEEFRMHSVTCRIARQSFLTWPDFRSLLTTCPKFTFYEKDDPTFYLVFLKDTKHYEQVH